jgi:hypothetical protein
MPNEPAPEEQKPQRTFADMVVKGSLGTLLSDRAFQTESDNAEGFNMPFIMGPIFDVIRNKQTRTPLTVGIYGGWGTGKTSAMEWLHGIILASNKTKKPETKIIPVWFYPWKYQTKDDVWRGIIAEVILATLDKTTLMEAGNADLLTAEGRETILNAAKRFLPALGKTFGYALGKIALKASAKADVKTLNAEISLESTNLKQIIDELQKNLDPERNYLNSFENDLTEWVEKQVKGDERIVVFIDDLDRCLPEVTLQVLESLKLYLNIPKLIFVVGVDKDVVEQIVIKHYDTQGVNKEKAEQYLAKMFQIEVQVGPTEQEIGDYFEKTVASMAIWNRIKPEYQKVLSDTIKSIAKRNPREIKRVANAALLGGMGAHWNLGDENAFGIGVMIYLLKNLLRKNLSEIIGNTEGDKFLHEVSFFVQTERKDLLLQLREYQSNAKQNKDEPTHKLAVPAELSPLDRPEWKPFYPFFELADLDLILNLLIVPYPEDSGRFAQPTIEHVGDEDPVRKALRNDPNPNILDLSFTETSDKSLALLRRLTSLSELYLRRTQVTNDGLVHLKGLTSLSVLYLSGTQVTNDGLVHLKGLTSLSMLSLDGTQVTNDGLVHLKGLTSLSVLSLSGTQVTNDGLVHLKGLTSLSMLYLDGTQVTNDGLVHLKGLTSLSVLSLSGTQVTNDGLVHLKGLTSLSMLSLSGTQVTNDGLVHLKGLTSLSMLYLRSTKVTEKACAELKTHIPGLKINL